MRLVPLLDIGFYTTLRREIQLKCELYNENFQNFKSYNIPKAQLIIADIPYNIGKNFYGSNPSWYVGGNRENGESKLAGKAAFNTDYSFNITEFFHFVSRMLKPDPKKKTEGNEPPCIRNVHYALLTIAEDGSYSFGTPVPMPGAVSLSMDPNGEPSVFYADGYAYYTISNNQGYEGDLELAMVPDSFRTDVLKENLDKNKVLVEEASVATEQFALLFEFDGDINKIRHVLYNCSAARPTIESTTTEDEIEVKTETLSIKASPLQNGLVKARTSATTTSTAYDNWYKSVYVPVKEV